jgi:hypothetical protein
MTLEPYHWLLLITFIYAIMTAIAVYKHQQDND